jgi:tRNA1Val (adenine37-N6)-methyltransferase
MNNIELFPNERLDKVNENLTLIQKKDGLTFGTDAFLLASFIKSAPSKKAAELGAGTCIISLLLAQLSMLANIYAIEIQKDFAELTERNALLNGLDSKITTLNSDVTQIKSSDIGGELDVVFTNPPYMKADSGKRNISDAKYIARHEACGDINYFCAAGFRLLKHGGKFYVVWRPDRLCDLFYALRKNRLEPKIITFVHADTSSEPSIVLVSAIKGGASSARVTAPLILYGDGTHKKMTERAERIYDTLSFD